MMRLNVYRKSGKIMSYDVPDARGYDHLLSIINHPLAAYYRVTVTDPLAGDRILRDSYDDERKVA